MRGVLAALVAVGCLAGAVGLAATQVDGSARPSAVSIVVPPRPEPRTEVEVVGLECPNNKMVQAIFDFFSDVGGDPKEDIRDRYAEASGYEAVLQGNNIFLLRDDGTAFQEMHLEHVSDGWRVSGYSGCTDISIYARTRTTVKLESGPCGILPVEIDGRTYVAPPATAPSFESADPGLLTYSGVIRKDGLFDDELQFRDFGGGRLLFYPLDHPRVAPVAACLTAAA